MTRKMDKFDRSQSVEEWCSVSLSIFLYFKSIDKFLLLMLWTRIEKKIHIKSSQGHLLLLLLLFYTENTYGKYNTAMKITLWHQRFCQKKNNKRIYKYTANM